LLVSLVTAKLNDIVSAVGRGEDKPMTEAEIALHTVKDNARYRDVALRAARLRERDPTLQDATDKLTSLTGKSGDQMDVGVAEWQRQFTSDLRLYARSILSHERVEVACDLPLDSVEMDSPNAFVLHFQMDDSYAIGVDYSFVPALSIVTSIALHTLDCSSADKPKALALLMQAVVDQTLLHFTPEYVEGLEERQFRLLSVITPFSRQTDAIVHSAMRFVVCHELAHIVLGHFSRGSIPRLSAFACGDQQGEISTFDHKREYLADSWAAKVLSESSPTPLVHPFFGPTVLFSLVNLVHQIVAPRSEIGRRTCASHPPPEVRAQRLVEMLRETGVDRNLPDQTLRRITEIQVLFSEMGTNEFLRRQIESIHQRLRH
jgi:hypothetical protein